MVARHLDRELPARRQKLQQARKHVDMAVEPLIGGVAVEDAGRQGRLEMREIALGEGDPRIDRLAARLGQHLLRGIDADDRRSREALGEDARDVARAAAEIVDRMPRPRAVGRIESAHQIERRPRAMIGELQVEIGVPGRRLHVVHGHFSSKGASSKAPSTGTRYAMAILLPFCAASTTAMNSSCISSVMPLPRAMAPCEAMQ